MLDVGVILLNMGGPQSGSEVRSFLKAMFNDPDLMRLPARGILAPLIVALRTPVAKRHYAQIKGGSPLLSISLEQADSLERLLSKEADGSFKVRVGMRYTLPSIEDAIDDLEKSGCKRIVCLSMYPQYCGATTGSSIGELQRVLKARSTDLDVKIVDRYFDHPGYMDVVADTVRDAIEDESDPPFVLFSAHGIPTRMVDEGDPYVEETKASANGVVERLGLEQGRWKLAFQSRVGPLKWVGPSTEQVIRDVADSGISSLLFVPISFTADNLETLYDIEIVLARKARSYGISQVSRARALNADKGFIDSLATMVRKALGE